MFRNEIRDHLSKLLLRKEVKGLNKKVNNILSDTDLRVYKKLFHDGLYIPYTIPDVIMERVIFLGKSPHFKQQNHHFNGTHSFFVVL